MHKNFLIKCGFSFFVKKEKPSKRKKLAARQGRSVSIRT